MKRILVPCDFSLSSEKAINFAIDLTDTAQDELFLVNVINDINDSKFSTKQDANLKELGRKLIKLTYVRKPGVLIHHKILSGRFLTSILSFIETDKIDLVVMGTHGSRGWGEYFMGSNIEKVVRTSPVPVFAVRGDQNRKSIHDIVFPCNLKLDQSEVLSKVKELQKTFHSRLHLLRIHRGKSLNDITLIDKLKEYATHYQLSNYTITVVNDANVKDGILHFAREINADMIAMVTHGKRNLKHLFTESTTADIVNHANILVWTYSS
ncbi:universal stress protein [Dyadobacter arcticus]|uniref:Nucleotide-binding universal stress UspA family protein n=1 Tax=Dyadobacter arcticus TaxID=1078754 RepID=A0ABX0UHQ9_9BACT|nr:universal stress protein [Dyadobacter arcticus]NIJ52562.1 nucleotide-binding universal stress UspA family protein [Dyadobacter arcticus]